MQRTIENVSRFAAALFILATSISAAYSAAPERRVSAREDAGSVESYITVPVRLTGSGITDVINRLAPQSLSTSGLEGSKMAGVEYDATVAVKEPFAAVAVRDGVNVKGTLRGAGEMKVWATRIRILREFPTGDVALDAHARVDIDPDWMLTADLDVNYSWVKEPKVVWNTFSIASFIDPMIKREIEKTKDELPDMMYPLSQRLEMAMAGFWDNMQNPIAIPDMRETPLWMHIEPIDVSMLAPRSRDGDLLLNIGIRANVRVTADAGAPAEKTFLPLLSKEPFYGEGFRLSVPVPISYGLLEKELSREYEKQREIRIDSGRVATVAFDGWEVYSSHPSLAVGTNITAEIPDSSLRMEDRLHFSAIPDYDPESGMLYLRNVEFSPRAEGDSPAAEADALRDGLAALFEENAAFDLRKSLDAPLASANKFLAEDMRSVIGGNADSEDEYLRALLDSMRLTGSMEKIENAFFTMDEENLIVHPVFAGTLSLELVPALQ